jgi:MinD-like ATPase involved in chromosome partitioning or flagellar assembly
VRALLAALKRQFLVTVIDCSGTFSEQVMAALETADRLIVVCTPELVTLRDLRDCNRILGQALHIDPKRVWYVLNHPHSTTRLTRRQFEDAFDQTVMLEIEHAGPGATKPNFARAISRLVTELASADGLRMQPEAPAKREGPARRTFGPLALLTRAGHGR